jgi:DNA-binding transcriptional LysR family regulator
MSALSRKGLSLERLQAFRSIHQARGISKAAPGDPVRQSQLSRQLSELEGALQVTLFERRNRGLHPTEAARALARVVHELEEGLRDITGARNEPALIVGAGGSVIQWLILPGHQPQNGQLQLVTCSSEEIVDGLLDGSLDVGIVRERRLPSAIDSTPLGRVQYRWFCSKARVRRPEGRAVGEVPLVSVTGEPTLAPILASLGRPTLESETFVQAAAAIETGHFAGVLPAFASTMLDARRFWALELAPLGAASSTLQMAWVRRAEERRPVRTRVQRALANRLKTVLR